MNSRDHSIVLLVAYFGHLTSGRIRSLVFPLNKSNTSSDRALLRLVERRYLKRVELPGSRPGGALGGRSQYIYELGEMGKRLLSSDLYKTARISDIRHTFGIADMYIAAFQFTENGRFEVVDYATEPRSWHTIAGRRIRPDLYLTIGDRQTSKLYDFWLEIDMGHQRESVIKDKLDRYRHAHEFTHHEDFPLPAMPRVIFLVPDEERRKVIRRLIAREPENARSLFDVKLQAEFPRDVLI